LDTVPYDETKHLVKKFFQKIIDLKEIEQKHQIDINELQTQLEEERKLCGQLKQALSLSTNDLDRRLNDQKMKAENNCKLLRQQLNERTNKISTMEREILTLKEKIIKLKSNSHLSIETTEIQPIENLKSSVNHLKNQQSSMGGSVSTTSIDSFHLKSSSNNLDQEQSELSTNKTAISTTTFKISKKDLRRLTEQEILQRSSKKPNAI
jgi:hypothetical protein